MKEQAGCPVKDPTRLATLRPGTDCRPVMPVLPRVVTKVTEKIRITPP